jgi:membrane associated rhomboid family serine protease
MKIFRKSNAIAIKISFALIIIYALSFLIPILYEELSLISFSIIKKPWTIFTYAFLHSKSDVSHLFYNVFALSLFGSILEKIVGSKRFLLIFFSSIIFSGIGGVLFYNAIIGASGGIMGIIGVLTILKPKMIVWVGAPLPLILVSFLWILGDFIGIFYPENIAHISHLLGMFYGLLIGFFIKRRMKKFEKKKEARKEYEKISEKEIEEWEEKWIKF